MLHNREKRNGLILSHTQHKSYGKYSKAPNKARYNLSDLVLDLSQPKTQDFDISNDSFKLSDDEMDYAGAVRDDTMGSFTDEPYGSHVIHVAISDNESDEESTKMEAPAPPAVPPLAIPMIQSTPLRSKRKSVLQEITSPNVAVSTHDKRMSLATLPALSRNGSSNLEAKNRSSTHSSSGKRWSLMSFGDDKENIKSKRFSITSVQSSSKRFSIASSSSTSSSFKNAVSKVGNVLSSVSISSGDASAETTPYKNIQPGVVGEYETSNKRPLSSSNAPALSSPVVPRKYSQPTSNVAITTAQSSYQNERTREYSNTSNGNTMSRVASNADMMSMYSTNTSSSLKSSKSRFRLSSLFSSSKKDNDSESVRSVRGKSSFSDLRKNVLSMSSSKQSLFRLGKKESMQDLKHKPSVDKMMISLPKPSADSANKLKNKLRNSASIISINSVVSSAPTVATANTVPTVVTVTSASATTMANIEDEQLRLLLELSTSGEVLNFQQYISRFANAENQILVKYAEASYSEVFVLKNYMTSENLKIFKIIPFGEDQSEQPLIDNVIQELQVNLRLNHLEGFITLNEAHVVEGSYPKLLMKLWDDYRELKGSKNYRPEYGVSQKYLIMDLEYGGVDLENFKMLTWKQALEVFWSTVKSLSEAEQKFQFEHRDLHWGNIVIDYKQRELEDAFRDLSVIEEDNDDELCVKIIDYTLSRLEGDSGVTFTRLDHQDFFKGRGDYQFDIYRFMRAELKAKQMGDDVDWSVGSFKTNLYWLHYLLDKLVNEKKIIDNDKTSQKKIKTLHQSLNPRRKKLSASENKFFEDFDHCGDVLAYGEEKGLI